MGDETRPPLFPARSSSMFYVYMVFADILAQQTTNVKQNQVLGITETKSRLIGRGFMLCPAEKSFDSGKLACDNKAKEVFPERMKQAGDTMKYIASPNLVLEALVYLGARANSYDQAYLESRLTSKGYQDLSRFRQRYAPFAALRQQLDAQVHVPEAHLKGLFVDLVSIAQNTGGAYSIALLLFAPAACQCSGDLEQFLASMARRTPAQIARDILVSFDLSHLLPPTADGCVELLQENLSTLSLTTRGRSALMKAYRHYGTTLEHVSQCLRPVVAALEEMRPTLQRLAEEYSAQIADTDLETYLRKESGFQLKDDVQYQLRPLLISPSANIFFDMAAAGSENIIYCGVLQDFLRNLLQTDGTSKNHIFRCLHLLGDQTRFDIFCYLLERPAYGQELSDHFGLARNTIHHHMNKLFDAGLMTYMVKGTRVYYSIDKDHFSNLLDQQRQLLLHGYRTPGK